MPFQCASLLLMLAGARGVELSWPAIECPEREQVMEFLDALLPGDAKAVVRTSTLPPDRLELAIESEGRTVHRAVVLIGECDRRAATVAAVIERVLTAGAVSTATAATATIASAPPPRAPIEGPLRAGWIGAGGHAAIGISGELGWGFDLEGAWWAFDPIGLGLRATYRLPEISRVGEGDVRIDELRADLLLLWQLLDDLALEARLFGQIAWARSRRIVETKRATLFNPGVGFGARYRIPFDPIEVGISVRTLIPFRSQRFLVDGAEVAHLPRFQFEAALGVSYAF